MGRWVGRFMRATRSRWKARRTCRALPGVLIWAMPWSRAAGASAALDGQRRQIVGRPTPVLAARPSMVNPA
jgi:hypothetical protein